MAAPEKIQSSSGTNAAAQQPLGAANGKLESERPAAGGEINFSWAYLGRSIEITGPSPGAQPLYHANLPFWSTYDVILHQGGDSNGPILGAGGAKGRSGIRLCTGDPDSQSAQWLQIKPPATFGARKWEMTVAGAKGTRVFDWSMTSSADDGVTFMRKILQSYRMVDRSTGKLVAVYLANFGGTGQLLFHEEMSPEMKVWVTMTAIILVLKGRRAGAAVMASAGAS